MDELTRKEMRRMSEVGELRENEKVSFSSCREHMYKCSRCDVVAEEGFFAKCHSITKLGHCRDCEMEREGRREVIMMKYQKLSGKKISKVDRAVLRQLNKENFYPKYYAAKAALEHPPKGQIVKEVV